MAHQILITFINFNLLLMPSLNQLSYNKTIQEVNAYLKRYIMIITEN